MAQREFETQFLSGEKKLNAFIATPAKSGVYPAVVVIHEIFGLTDSIRDAARHLAQNGYAALAVDLFSGTNRTLCIVKTMGALLTGSRDHAGITDLKAALDFFSKQTYVDATRVGAIGFCMGGNFALAWATKDKRLKTIAPFYAMNPKPISKLSSLCPVVGSYPEKDFTAKAGRKLEAALQTFKINHDIKIYPGAKHSFMNKQGKDYHAQAEADAWIRTLEFFKPYLSP